MNFFAATPEREAEPGTCLDCGYATEDQAATVCNTCA
jgi:hypothetical protein